jgi:predicted nucleic acid-binding protein
MIHLDTNYLIRLLSESALIATKVESWLTKGETLATSAIAWSEFLCGPVEQRQVEMMFQLLEGGIAPFAESEARLAAELFNRTGRKRGTRVDCFVAAVALRSGASLATQDQGGFRRFEPFGLTLLG